MRKKGQSLKLKGQINRIFIYLALFTFFFFGSFFTLQVYADACMTECNADATSHRCGYGCPQAYNCKCIGNSNACCTQYPSTCGKGHWECSCEDDASCLPPTNPPNPPNPPPPNPTNPPNNTPTPTGAPGQAYCQSFTLSKTSLSSGETLDMVATASNSDIKTFTFKFFNLDNLDSAKNPKPIKFDTSEFVITKTLGVTSNTQTVTVNFSDIDKPDLNWTYYAPKPKNIKIDVYFAKADGKSSNYDANCSKNLSSKAVDATPTPNPNCLCKTDSKCDNSCFFDWFPTVTPYQMKCSLEPGIFQTAPSADNKTSWCRAYKRVRGDANADGTVNLLDYFYYAAVRYGAKVPPTVNVDFNGDGIVDSSNDRSIIINSVK